MLTSDDIEAAVDVFKARRRLSNADLSRATDMAIRSVERRISTCAEAPRALWVLGKIADMCILNENPLTLHKSKLRSIKSEKLILNGNDYITGQGIGELLLRRLFGKKGMS